MSAFNTQVEPQTNASKELQLINRIYRIGQTRPVVIKKFFCVATVEARVELTLTLALALT